MAIEAWPAGLPVPQKSFNCQLRAGLANDQAYIYPQRIRTYPERSSVFSLVLTQTEFEALQTFYQTTLNGGSELFTADWLEDGGFDYHRLRFLKPFEASLQDGIMWKVKMNLEIISSVPFDGADVAYWPCEE
jgi:hypothetical protein